MPIRDVRWSLAQPSATTHQFVRQRPVIRIDQPAGSCCHHNVCAQDDARGTVSTKSFSEKLARLSASHSGNLRNWRSITSLRLSKVIARSTASA